MGQQKNAVSSLDIAVSDLIRPIVEMRGLKPGKIAEQIGGSRQTIDRLLKGERAFQLSEFHALCLHIGLDPIATLRQAQARAASTMATNDGGASGLDGVSSDDLLAEIRRRIKDL